MPDDLKRTQRRDVIDLTNRRTQRFGDGASELREIAVELTGETDDVLTRFLILLDGVPPHGDANVGKWIHAAGKTWHAVRSQYPRAAKELSRVLVPAEHFSCDDALPSPSPEWSAPRGAALLELARADREELRRKIEAAFAT
jgi:hypothetical protein